MPSSTKSRPSNLSPAASRISASTASKTRTSPASQAVLTTTPKNDDRDQNDSVPDSPHSSQATAQAPPRPPFKPLFTLIEDSRTETHTHPAVHYVFSDDDGEGIVDAIAHVEELRVAYERSARGHAAQGSRPGSGASARERQGGRGKGTKADRAEKRSGVEEERFVLVTLGADGRSVETAHSLSADWQVVGAEIKTAPMLEDRAGSASVETVKGAASGEVGDRTSDSATDEATQRAGARDDGEKARPLMLRIRGIERIGGEDSATDAGGDGSTRPASEILIEEELQRFKGRMAELSSVVVRAEKDFVNFARFMGLEGEGSSRIEAGGLPVASPG